MIVKPKSQAGGKRRRLWIILPAVLLAVALTISASYLILLKSGEAAFRKKQKPTLSLPYTEEPDSLPEGADAYYNGKAYYYNEDRINLLLIGVDKKNLSKKDKSQADALYLFSLDPERHVTDVIAISRNTVSEIDVYGEDGQFVSTDRKQICLSYVYGGSDSRSSELTVESVSRLFYGLPIHGYYTIFMDCVADIVDAVGGVPLYIDEDMTSVSPEMKQGATVTLNGSNAIRALQFRRESNEPRLNRQKQFVSSFFSQAKSATLKNLSLPLTMYNKLSKNTVTNVSAASAVYLSSQVIKTDFRLQSVPGTVGFDGVYETFEADSNALYQLVLTIFYNQVS